MKTYFPNLKRWRKALNVTNDEAMKVNPALAGVKELIAQMADSLPIAYISSVDSEGYPYTKAMRHVSWIYCRRKYSFYVKLKLKSGKRLTRPLGHELILRLILESAASLGGTRDKTKVRTIRQRAPSPLVCTRLAIKNIAR